MTELRSEQRAAQAPAAPTQTWMGAAVAALLVSCATAVGYLLRNVIGLPDLVMLYLLVIMIVSVRFDRSASIVAAALSGAAYDFFFVPPVFHFMITDVRRHILTFVMMFGVGLLISGLTLGIRRREAERLRLAEEARSAELRARTEEMRSSLLSAVSHDLRTPLAALTGSVTTLREAETLSALERAELLQSIYGEADRLERILRNLLDMTRVQSGTLAVAREWVPLEEMVGSALTRLGQKLGSREVTTDLRGDLPLIAVDPVLFEQVFVNLLDNAAKYTPPESPLEIAARITATSVEIDFADHGPGIASGAEEQIFDKFFRGAHVGSVRGVGLGLPICRGIVEAHGGRISATNREAGGALFRIVLPRRDDAPKITQLLEADADSEAVS